jgi:hypothetical protein
MWISVFEYHHWMAQVEQLGAKALSLDLRPNGLNSENPLKDIQQDRQKNSLGSAS